MMDVTKHKFERQWKVFMIKLNAAGKFFAYKLDSTEQYLRVEPNRVKHSCDCDVQQAASNEVAYRVGDTLLNGIFQECRDC